MEMIGRFRRSILDNDGGFDGQEEETFSNGPNDLFSLSPLQSMYAFAASLLMGFLLLFLSLFVVFQPIKFTILFTFGNILAVGSTIFIIGPSRQARMMFDSIRVYATIIYIGSVLLALLSALLIQSTLLTLIAMIAEICALIWYSLSYIPFARRMASELIISLCDTEI
ncbi:putative Vesicle transport protein SFT2B [Zostera marina]|uniref:Vesicle transport protein n=1 Tax=Zostera marina TaxID=29655 RepID=A0A0K9PLH9_ZOSMR|nr:putative Vesicle transport protein SFT2B [Zostera marina]